VKKVTESSYDGIEVRRFGFMQSEQKMEIDDFRSHDKNRKACDKANSSSENEH
jgi:hypothetical protein